MKITNETIYEFKCPHCHTTLCEDYGAGMELHGDYVTRTVIGYYPECSKEYQWEENYKFDGVCNLKEIKETESKGSQDPINPNSIGGQMVRKMIEFYEKKQQGKIISTELIGTFI